MVYPLTPGDDTNPEPGPAIDGVAGGVQSDILPSAFAALQAHGLSVAESKAAADAIFGGVGLDDIGTALRYGDLVAQAYHNQAVSGAALPSALPMWISTWQTARMAVEAGGDFLLDLA